MLLPRILRTTQSLLRTTTATVTTTTTTTTTTTRPFSTSIPTKSLQEVYILSAVRTPTAKFNGSFKGTPAPTLASHVIKEALARSTVPASEITNVYLGNVLSASLGQAPARQAAILAGLPETTEATTINKVCASGLKSVCLAAQDIRLGLSAAQIAGGMENMSLVPRYYPRNLPPFGNVISEDGLIKDGLTDVYEKIHMGNCVENTVKNMGITRLEQDEYAIESYRRAKTAWDKGVFNEEVLPIPIKDQKGEKILMVAKDEEYEAVKLEKIPTLKPAFQRESGTITAANSSTFSDGASALVLGNKDVMERYGKNSKALAKIVSYADAATKPIDFPLAPTLAIPLALERAGLQIEGVARWEINEAFAAVSKAIEKVLGLDPEKVNVRGGAIALGHALGSSGSRILTTLLYTLKEGEFGVAAICNGGGGATALVVQKM